MSTPGCRDCSTSTDIQERGGGLGHRALALACLLVGGCVPQALTASTIREERRVSREVVDALDRADRVLGTVGSQVAAVGSQAASTIRSAQGVLDTLNQLIGVGVGVAATAAAAYAVKTYGKSRNEGNSAR